jgi:dTDP-4-dehydrorhamnose reductase
MVAEATAYIIAQKGWNLGDVAGIYHLTCQGRTNWYEFAQEILNRPIFISHIPLYYRDPCWKPWQQAVW